MAPASPLAVFALNASRTFGEQVAAHLGVALSAHEEREFDDGEHKARPLVNVRDRDVFVLQSLYTDARQSVNDKLCRLLFFIACLHDASAARVTAVVPYLAYARKDRQTQPRDPVTSRYVAALFEAVGTDRIVTLDVHNLAAYQNAFRCRTDHLDANPLFVEYFAKQPSADELAVVSPDVGGVKRAEKFRAALGRRLGRELPLAFMEKTRAKGVLRSGRLVGEVGGKTAILIDDLISSGGTLLGAAAACREQGARRVLAAASHGVFIAGAERLFDGRAIDQVVVTDTLPPTRLDPAPVADRRVVLPAAALFAQAIDRIYRGGSLVELLTT